MNRQVQQHTERMTRASNAENHRNKQAAQKEHHRPDDATYIAPKLSLMEKWKKKRAERHKK